MSHALGMSRPVPYTFDGAAPSAPLVPVGNRMGPSSEALPVNKPDSWKPGQDQNTLTLRGQVKPWTPAVKPRAPFRLG